MYVLRLCVGEIDITQKQCTTENTVLIWVQYQNRNLDGRYCHLPKVHFKGRNLVTPCMGYFSNLERAPKIKVAAKYERFFRICSISSYSKLSSRSRKTRYKMKTFWKLFWEKKDNKFLSSNTESGFGRTLHRSSMKLNAFLVKNGSFCLFSFVAYCENKVHRSKKAGSHQRIQRIEGGCLLLSNHMHSG